MQDLTHLAREAMRWPGASDRLVASIVTAALIDLGVVIEEDKLKIVDQHKVRNLLRENRLILPPYPSHTQSVERVIREITDVSARCVGQEKRHGMLLARYSGRKAMPKANTKREMEGMISPVTQ